MSRKDYKKFAEIFKTAHENCNIDNPQECASINTLIFEAAKIFHYDKPNFRPYDFFLACGYSKEAAGPLTARI